jgi:hypothetical protein
MLFPFCSIAFFKEKQNGKSTTSYKVTKLRAGSNLMDSTNLVFLFLPKQEVFLLRKNPARPLASLFLCYAGILMNGAGR